jgi:hypothetical protein
MKSPIIIILLALAGLTTTVFAQDNYTYENKNNIPVLHITVDAQINDPTTNLKPFSLELYELIGKSETKLAEQRDVTPKYIIKEVAADHPDSANTKGLVFDFKLDRSLNLGIDPATKKSISYEVRIFYSGILWRTIKDDNLLKPSFVQVNDTPCENGDILLTLAIKQAEKGDQSAIDYWSSIVPYLNDLNLKDKIDVTASENFKPIDGFGLESAKLLTPNIQFISNQGEANICLTVKTIPPTGAINLSVQFKDHGGMKVPYYLGAPFIGKAISWSASKVIKKSFDIPDDPDKRKIENNLDLGLSFNSAVATDSTTKIRSRSSNGILDVRLAPWLDDIRDDLRKATIIQWNPIYLNANVATGKITKSTLSLNRVILGTDLDFHFVPKRKSVQDPDSGEQIPDKQPYKKLRDAKKAKCDKLPDRATCGEDIDKQKVFTNYYRLTISGKHSSDRDFKQKEITAESSFEPIWGFLNKPRNDRWFYGKIPDTVTGERGKKYPVLGWEIYPTFGFQFGKTYSRRDPASVVKESDLIKRLNVGITMNFDITSHLNLSIVDTFYSRYELKPSHNRNYLITQMFAPLGNIGRASNGVFFSFEKGDAPPFTSTVNVLKFGYRIQIQSNEGAKP